MFGWRGEIRLSISLNKFGLLIIIFYPPSLLLSLSLDKLLYFKTTFFFIACSDVRRLEFCILHSLYCLSSIEGLVTATVILLKFYQTLTSHFPSEANFHQSRGLTLGSFSSKCTPVILCSWLKLIIDCLQLSWQGKKVLFSIARD